MRGITAFVDLSIKAVTFAGMAAIAACTVASESDTAVGAFALRGGTVDLGVMRGNGQWLLDQDGNDVWTGPPQDLQIAGFGNTTDLPEVVSWNRPSGTRARIAAFRSGEWFIDVNGNGTYDPPPAGDVHYQFGQSGDKPFVCAFNLNSTPQRDQVGVFRGAGQWLIDYNADGVWQNAPVDRFVASFGAVGDIPVPGAWNAQLFACQVGVFRSGVWMLDANANGVWDGPAGGDVQYSFGQAGDVPVTGDWNGDNRADIGVFRSGTWFLDMNNDGVWQPGVDVQANFGTTNDRPVVGTFTLVQN